MDTIVRVQVAEGEQVIDMQDDLISREDTIREIVKRSATDFMDVEAIATVIHIVNQMPSAQTEQQWISCSERLPDKNGEYLITLEMMDGTYECDMDKFNGKKWDCYHKGDVVAWQTLPEPYRGDDQ